MIRMSCLLTKIIYDFFDILKSRITRGYASATGRQGLQKATIVRLERLLNGEVCDALSPLLFTETNHMLKAQRAEKLKEAIPRQMFEVPIQAAIGLARSLRAKPSRPCARMYSPSATAAISRAKRSCWKSRKGQKTHAPGGQRRGAVRAFMSVLKMD